MRLFLVALILMIGVTARAWADASIPPSGRVGCTIPGAPPRRVPHLDGSGTKVSAVWTTVPDPHCASGRRDALEVTSKKSGLFFRGLDVPFAPKQMRASGICPSVTTTNYFRESVTGLFVDCIPGDGALVVIAGDGFDRNSAPDLRMGLLPAG
jgi:hypothetical protein